MILEEVKDKFNRTVRCWKCECGAIWELILSKNFPDRYNWEPTCLECFKRESKLEQEKKYETSVSFWATEQGTLHSHSKGLTEDQVKMLNELKVGDRLVIFKNNKREERHPDYSMKKGLNKNNRPVASDS